ncbi:MAG: inositol monophosphatase family protein [Candidatus Sericytochromatia bacterium]
MLIHQNVKKILFEASEIVEKYFKADLEVSYKEDHTPVTIADKEVNTFLKPKLLELIANSAWLSEEEKDDKIRLKSEYIWVVDPIDGTKEFTKKIPELAISIGLVKDNKPILGAIMNPITKEGGICSIWESSDFWGFNKDKDKNKVSVIVSRSEYKSKRLSDFEKEVNITPIGSVAYKLLRISAGMDDLYFSVFPKSEWDICAGVAMIELTDQIYSRFDKKDNHFNMENTRIDSGALAGKKELVADFKNRFDSLLVTQFRD